MFLTTQAKLKYISKIGKNGLFYITEQDVNLLERKTPIAQVIALFLQSRPRLQREFSGVGNYPTAHGRLKAIW